MATQIMTKLNIGCGLDHKEGWINVDALKELKPDVVLDILNPWPWNDASVDEVLVQDILEHFTYEDLQHVMTELTRVTKQGAKVTVRVPHIEKIISQFANDPMVRNLFLYGATDQTGVFGAHKVGFTPELLTTLFTWYGFTLKNINPESTNWHAEFVRSERKALQKVVWFIHSHSWGGAEVYFSDLISFLAKSLPATHQIVTTNAQLRISLHEKGISVRKLNTYAHFIGDWKSMVKSVVLLPTTLIQYGLTVWKNRGADVFVCATFTDMLFVTPFAYMFGIPAVWNEFGPVKPLLRKWFRVPEALYRMLLPFVERVIVPSEFTKKSLSQESRVSVAKIAVVPCGRDIGDASHNTKRGLKSKKNDQKIVCVSRFEKGKGQEIVVRAFAKVLEVFPAAKLVFVGTGQTKPSVQSLVHSLGLDPSVEFKGFVEDSLREIETASICVFPSTWNLEGFGLVAIEAMALGKPVITFDSAPMNEITIHKKTGLLVPLTTAEDDNVTAFSQAIKTLLKNDELRQQLGVNAREHFLNHYTIEQSAMGYEAQLRWAVASLESKKQLAHHIDGQRL